MKLIKLFFWINIFIFTNLFAQTGSVSGYVYTEQNEPAIGATVFISNSNLGSSCNEVGFFKIENIPVGSYELLVRSIGYEQTEIPKITIKNNENVTVRIYLKTYEADMRYLIDTYIDADVSKRIDPFENQTLLEIVNKIGVEGAIETLPAGIRTSNESIAETITNNVRQKIIKEHLIDPFYFEEMSQLLNSIIKEYKAKRMSYVEYLKKIGDISHKITDTNRDNTPLTIQTPATRALYHNLAKNEEMAIQIDKIVREVKQDDFRGNEPKERIIKAEIFRILQNENEVEKIFAIIKAQREY